MSSEFTFDAETQRELAQLRESAYARLKPKRIPHVAGCEQTAVKFALQYGADPRKAAIAAILHDVTKKENLEEQLRLCRVYGYEPDEYEICSEKLLHSKTGALVAAAEYNQPEEICRAIRFHTTGCPGMNLLDQIIYLADYTEPTRPYEDIIPLREVCKKSLTEGMILGLQMSIAEIEGYGEIPHPNSRLALEYFLALRSKS